ncbi:MAG: hypothetical protein WA144_12525 [Candidatus Methanoperedens sp.]
MSKTKPREDKRIPIQASVLPELLTIIEEKRGLVKRSTFLNSIIEEKLQPEKRAREGI